MSGQIKRVIDHNGHDVEKDPNAYFNGCLDTAIDVMDGWHKDRAPFYVEAFEGKDSGLLIDRLHEALATRVVESGMRPKSTEDVRRTVASWVVYKWDPAKRGGSEAPTGGGHERAVSDVAEFLECESLGFNDPEGAAA